MYIDLVLAFLLCAAVSADADELARWVEAQGGLLGGEVREPRGKPRGLYASRDYEDGELVGWLPLSAAMPLVTENGHYLLKEAVRNVYDPASPRFVRGSWAPFWASQPPLSQLASFDWLPDDALQLLGECGSLAEVLSLHMRAHRQTYEELEAELDGSYSVSWEQFLHLSMLITTRAFCFHAADGSCSQYVLLPGLDMLNTGPPYSARRLDVLSNDTQSRRVEIIALGHVAAGEELAWSYDGETMRNDQRFLAYGYVQEEDTRLLAIDCEADGQPAFLLDAPLEEKEALKGDDPPAEGLEAAEAWHELRRLEGIASGLAPLQEDVARLKSLGDSQTHAAAVVLRLRIARKVALATRAQAVRSRLAQLGYEKPASSCKSPSPSTAQPETAGNCTSRFDGVPCSATTPLLAAEHDSVVLVMIVKNEAHVIEETLRSVLPHITAWSIVDTGSTDETQAVVERVLASRPGYYHHRAWRDFAYNRNEALELGRPLGPWLLMFDADDVLHGTGFVFGIEPCAAYDVSFSRWDERTFRRITLFNSSHQWAYEGVLHEVADTAVGEPPVLRQPKLAVWIENREVGARSRNPNKYVDDALILERAYEQEGAGAMALRYAFCCANAWLAAGSNANASKWYSLRAKGVDGWVEERYISYLNLISLEDDLTLKLRHAWAALELGTRRWEATHDALWSVNEHEAWSQEAFWLGWATWQAGGFMEEWSLFPMPEVYQYKFYDEFSVTAFHAGHYAESRGAAEAALLRAPKAERARIAANIQSARDAARVQPPELMHRRPTLCFYTGYVHVFNPETGRVYKDMWGSELALFYLAEQLQEEYEIFVTDAVQAVDSHDAHGGMRYLCAEDARERTASQPFDVMIVWRYMNYFLYFSAEEMARKTVLWMHDVYPAAWYNSEALPDDSIHLLHNVESRIDAVVCLTHWHKDFVSRYLRMDASPKWTVIGNGVPASTHDDQRTLSASPLRIPRRFIWVSYHVRGIEQLISFFPRIRELLPDAELHVFRDYDGPALSGDVSTYVKLRGFVSNSVIIDEMRQADYWFYPTAFLETFCTSASEAQLAGCIAIASDLAGLSETVNSDGGVLLTEEVYSDAYWAEALTAIARLELQPNLKEGMRLAAQAWAATQTWRQRKEDWLALLSENASSQSVC